MSVPSVTMRASIGMRYLGKPRIAFFILIPFRFTGVGDYSIAVLQSKTPAIRPGFLPYSISRCREMHHLLWETSRCGLSMPKPSGVAINTGQLTINCERGALALDQTLPRALVLRSVSPKAKLDGLEIH